MHDTLRMTVSFWEMKLDTCSHLFGSRTVSVNCRWSNLLPMLWNALAALLMSTKAGQVTIH